MRVAHGERMFHTVGAGNERWAWVPLCYNVREIDTAGCTTADNILPQCHGIAQQAVSGGEADITYHTVRTFAHLYTMHGVSWGGHFYTLLQSGAWCLQIQYYCDSFNRREHVLFTRVTDAQVETLRAQGAPVPGAPGDPLYTMVYPQHFAHVLPMTLELTMRCVLAYVEGVRGRYYEGAGAVVRWLSHERPYVCWGPRHERWQIVHLPPKRISVSPCPDASAVAPDDMQFLYFTGFDGDWSSVFHVYYVYQSATIYYGVCTLDYVRHVLARSFLGTLEDPVKVAHVAGAVDDAAVPSHSRGAGVGVAEDDESDSSSSSSSSDDE